MYRTAQLTVTGYTRMTGVWICEGKKCFYHNIEIRSGTHQISYPMDSGVSFPWIKLASHFHYMYRSTMIGLYIQTPIPSWHDA